MKAEIPRRIEILLTMALQRLSIRCKYYKFECDLDVPMLLLHRLLGFL